MMRPLTPPRAISQVPLTSRQQLPRHPLRLLINARRNMIRLRLHKKFPIPSQNSCRNRQTQPRRRLQPNLNHQLIIIPRRGDKSQSASHNRKNQIRLLQLQQWIPQLPHEFPARRLQNIQVTRMINVVPNRALSVNHPLIMPKYLASHKSAANLLKPAAAAR